MFKYYYVYCMQKHAAKNMSASASKSVSIASTPTMPPPAPCLHHCRTFFFSFTLSFLLLILNIENSNAKQNNKKKTRLGKPHKAKIKLTFIYLNIVLDNSCLSASIWHIYLAILNFKLILFYPPYSTFASFFFIRTATHCTFICI